MLVSVPVLDDTHSASRGVLGLLCFCQASSYALAVVPAARRVTTTFAQPEHQADLAMLDFSVVNAAGVPLVALLSTTRVSVASRMSTK